MKSRDFCYWLQGHLELNPDAPMSAEQVEIVKRHLALVFKHEIDPSMGDAKHQAELNAVHTPPKPGVKPEPWQGGQDDGRLPGGILRC